MSQPPATDVADELAVRTLVARFSDAVNRRAPADLGVLWEPDGIWVIPGLGETQGREGIEQRLSGLLSGFEQLSQLVHSGEVRVDGDEARGRWYLSEFGVDTSGTTVQFVGVYHDHVRRGDHGWRFARRRFDFLHRARLSAEGKTYPFPTEASGWS